MNKNLQPRDQVYQTTLIEIGHEIFSTGCFLPNADIGQLLVTGERMCTEYW